MRLTAAMSFREEFLHLLFGPKTNVIKDDEGDSIDPFLTDEPKTGLPVATDVEWTLDMKFITCKFNSYIYGMRMGRAFKVGAGSGQKPYSIHVINSIERLLLHPRMG